MSLATKKTVKTPTTKKVPVVENIMSVPTIDDDDDDDSDIELKPIEIPPPPPPVKKRTPSIKKTAPAPAPAPVEETPPPEGSERIPYVEVPKKRKVYNISPEQREAKKALMLHARSVKVAKYQERLILREEEKNIQNEYLEKVIVAKADKIKKKRTKIDKLLKNITDDADADNEATPTPTPRVAFSTPIITKTSIRWL